MTDQNPSRISMSLLVHWTWSRLCDLISCYVFVLRLFNCSAYDLSELAPTDYERLTVKAHYFLSSCRQ